MILFKIIALIFGVIFGFKLVHITSEFFAPHIGDANGFLPLISFLAVFIIVIIIVNLIGKMVKNLLNLTILGSVDSIAGALLNILKWSFILGTIFWLLTKAGIGLSEKQTNDSILYPILTETAPLIIDFFGQLIPFTSDLVEYIKELKLHP